MPILAPRNETLLDIPVAELLNITIDDKEYSSWQKKIIIRGKYFMDRQGRRSFGYRSKFAVLDSMESVENSIAALEFCLNDILRYQAGIIPQEFTPTGRLKNYGIISEYPMFMDGFDNPSERSTKILFKQDINGNTWCELDDNGKKTRLDDYQSCLQNIIDVLKDVLVQAALSSP